MANLGAYWPTENPEGGWMVVYWSPKHPEWLRVIARFDDESRAESYAEVENDLLDDEERTFDDVRREPPKCLPPPTRLLEAVVPTKPPQDDETKSQKERESDLANLILENIDAWFASRPNGLTANDIVHFTKMPYYLVLGACRHLDHRGDARWVYRGGSNTKVLLPETVEIGLMDLSIKQAAVFDAMKDLADENGLVEKSQREIATAARASLGGINPVLYALEKKGYIMLSRPGYGARRAIYQILDKSKESVDG